MGCGYVADFYMATLPNYAHLRLIGVYDASAERAGKFSAHYGVPLYVSLEEILHDTSVEIVVNLTNPHSHYDVSRRALEAGKHVYSEKPFAQEWEQAKELVALAEQRSLILSSAPCSLLGETAQTLWRALRQDTIGRPRLVYAELDDGAIHQMPYRDWISPSGAPWPYADEFRVGPTLEHAGYYLTWLTAFFGPAAEVVAFAALVQPEKLDGSRPGFFAADFTSACITFHSGVVARLTCSTVAPENHTLQIVGDEGVLATSECWDYEAEVTLRKRVRGTDSAHHYLTEHQVVPLARPAGRRFRYQDTHDMDFARGVADMGAAVVGDGAPVLGARHALHVLEITLAIAQSTGGAKTVITSKFDEPRPMPWALH
ncbi:Gfo/Idh/MocA family oxidoreductase (plasmid) [Streptomyces sp. BB1-1-1]|uniref:Gfo/Idh/MocA family protein n=1 Tax=Streptomyces sp. BB1-1-1 TaxID=3074430 RepID=UPI0028774054|nr:Gfo/Idh/MocA family oxidoreductase [Streptomyces sp. BB1-1-1]WND40138.1 Gfo/Idh/MocA family oxidoreductase [Streptomyces sp. BB1-1-1]WND40978.1 Gfo/Idh/MocA family oxidoreductase [Streptomyces sp. BB1-1-1]